MSAALTTRFWKSWLNEISANRLIRAGSWLTFAYGLVGVLGYAYQVLMGRLLLPSEFALLSAIMALTMFFASPLNALFMLISRRVSSLRAHDGLVFLRNLYRRMHEYAVLAAVSLLLLLVIFGDNLQFWLKSPSQAPVWLFIGTLMFFAFVIINNAVFQGTQRFGWLGGSSLLVAALKIAFSMILVVWGYGVVGALFGILMASAVVWLIGAVNITKLFPRKEVYEQLSQGNFPLNTVLPVLVANIAFAAMTQLDMVFVNWYFLPEQAGVYAAASVLGKAALYLPGGLVLALYPMVAENHERDQGSAYMLLQSVVITTGLCSLVALVYWFLGEWIIALLYGPAYAGAGELLRWYGFAILPMTLVMVAEYFLIAKGRVLFAWLFLEMAPLQVLAIRIWHDELWMVIAVIGGCGTALVVVGYGILWREYHKAFLR